MAQDPRSFHHTGSCSIWEPTSVSKCNCRTFIYKGDWMTTQEGWLMHWKKFNVEILFYYYISRVDRAGRAAWSCRFDQRPKEVSGRHGPEHLLCFSTRNSLDGSLEYSVGSELEVVSWWCLRPGTWFWLIRTGTCLLGSEPERRLFRVKVLD